MPLTFIFTFTTIDFGLRESMPRVLPFNINTGCLGKICMPVKTGPSCLLRGGVTASSFIQPGDRWAGFG